MVDGFIWQLYKVIDTREGYLCRSKVSTVPMRFVVLAFPAAMGADG